MTEADIAELGENDLATIFQERIPLWQKSPELFGRDVCNFEPDTWQKKVFADIASSPRVSVRSGQGVGKTGCEGLLALWFLTCFPFSRVVATAPTRQQLNDVLWAEISKWQSNSPLLKVILKWTKTKVYMVGNEQRWFATARTATKAENMQGFHEDNMLFIVDEASGVADPIMEAISGTLSGVNNKLLMCGNPTKTSGFFYDSHNKDRALYKVHKVNSQDSIRTNKENIQALINKYGLDSNVVRVRVLGEFPEQEDDIFIPLSLVERSIMTDYVKANVKDVHSIDIGVDVARFGDDKTIIAYKVNEKADFYLKIRGQDTMKTANKIAELGSKLVRLYKPEKPIPVKIDDSGVGGGVTDRLRQLKELNPEKFDWMEVVPVHFGMRIKHKDYDDSTTYMMAIVKRLLATEDIDDDGNIYQKPVELVLPNDSDMAGQFSVRKYYLTDQGKLKVESKKVMKKRGVASPDEADAILLTCLPTNIKRKLKR